MKTALLASASAAAFFVLSGSAMAQTGDAASDGERARGDEIVVSATRREERLQDVPLSVTAFSQEDLNEKGIVGYEGLAFETPGAILNKPTSNFNTFSVRGIATNGYQANLQNSVAVYIDELPISANGNSTQLDSTLFDVERVEFLRGPQGTLFGKNTAAGAISVRTVQPGQNRDAFVDVTAGDLGLIKVSAAANVPINDNVALRGTIFSTQRDGYVNDYNLGHDMYNDRDRVGARLQLAINDPSDDFNVRVIADYS